MEGARDDSRQSAMPWDGRKRWDINSTGDVLIHCHATLAIGCLFFDAFCARLRTLMQDMQDTHIDRDNIGWSVERGWRREERYSPRRY